MLGQIVVHIAGEAKAGRQRCTRCGFVLRVATSREDDNWFYLPGALLKQIEQTGWTVRFVAVRCRSTCRRRRSSQLGQSAPAL
ncbi:hypothetical protein LCGC14_0795570 [marine sediment metagenome]|uniref:Uncharacterized protein n=2 Tax=root TaxID=1 RepID=A0A9C9NHB3_9HYPH|nr:hypothetical protein [Aurantimonas coralicida]